MESNKFNNSLYMMLGLGTGISHTKEEHILWRSSCYNHMLPFWNSSGGITCIRRHRWTNMGMNRSLWYYKKTNFRKRCKEKSVKSMYFGWIKEKYITYTRHLLCNWIGKSEATYPYLQESVNLQYNTLVHQVDWTNESSTKRLMFQV